MAKLERPWRVGPGLSLQLLHERPEKIARRVRRRRERREDADVHHRLAALADEERAVGQGDLIRIPPDTVHSIWPVTKNSSLRGLDFAIGIEGTGPVDYTS